MRAYQQGVRRRVGVWVLEAVYWGASRVHGLLMADTRTSTLLNDRPMKDYENGDPEFGELNRELVRPTYRRFCEELELPFHASSDLSGDPALALGEDRLHPDAMVLFNRLKPWFVFFKGDVVEYQFTTTIGCFNYEKTPVNRVLQETADQSFYLRHLEQRFEVVCSMVTGVVFCLAYALTIWPVLIIVAQRFTFPSVLLALAGPIALSLWFSSRIRRMPKRIVDDGRMKGFVKRVRDLQEKLAEIHGDRRSSLRQESQGKTIFSGLRESMSDEEIGESIRELQSRLSVVPGEGS